MIKVIFIGEDFYYDKLAYGKTYDVIKFLDNKKRSECRIVLLVNGNEECFRFTDYSGDLIFKDVTQEYRNDIINSILR